MSVVPEANMSIRMQLRIIRTLCTTPSTVLPNNQTAGYTAHMYLSNYNLLRNRQKQQHKKGAASSPSTVG